MKGLVGGALMLFVSLAPATVLADDSGAALFHSNCIICHGADGSGNTAIGKQNKVKDLKSPEVQKRSDAELSEIISKGKKPMPAYAGRLKPEQIQDIVGYLRELGKKH